MSRCRRCSGSGEEPDFVKMGAAARVRRERAGMTLRAVSAVTGYSVSYISDVERGRIAGSRRMRVDVRDATWASEARL